MHQSDWAFSGGKSWFSDHFGNDRLIDSDWIKRKSLAKKDLKEKKESKDSTREPKPAFAKVSAGNTHRNTKRTPLKKTGITRTKKSKTNSL